MDRVEHPFTELAKLVLFLCVSPGHRFFAATLQAIRNEVGTWTWTWMEPMIGTASFALLCAQFARAQVPARRLLGRHVDCCCKAVLKGLGDSGL